MKPKLTERQWEVLERMEMRGVGLGNTGSIFEAWQQGELLFVADTNAVRVLLEKGLIEWSDTNQEYTISLAGRAALAARRAEREGKGAK